jgi:hypothetical protein
MKTHTHHFRENKAAQQGRALLSRERGLSTPSNMSAVRSSSSPELLISQATAALHVDDIRGHGERQPAQNASAARELLELEHVVCRLDALLRVAVCSWISFFLEKKSVYGARRRGSLCSGLENI